MIPVHDPDSPAIVAPDGATTWGAWEARIERAAGRLSAAAPRGGVVAAVADDPVETAALVLGALRSGVAFAPLSARLPPAGVADALDLIGGVLLEGGRSADPERLPASVRGQPAVVVFTSGSSGEPRAALLTAEALLASASGVNEALGLRAGDRWLLDLPLHHVGGLGVVVRCALVGASMAVPAPGTPTAAALAALSATHASLVATHLFRLLRDPAVRPPDLLRAMLLGGSAVAPSLVDAAAERGWPVVTSYGLTEMASTVTASSFDGRVEERATAGRPLSGRVVRLAGGEIRVGGSPLFAGYLAAGGLELPVDAEGLFATGDLGRLDAAGCLHVTGRRDNRFVSGGENVQPEEVEAALVAVADVVRAVVVPVPDAEFGQRGVAFVEMEDGTPPEGARLAAAVAERLPRFMVPVRFLPWPDDGAGWKPGRAALAARALKEIGDRR